MLGNGEVAQSDARDATEKRPDLRLEDAEFTTVMIDPAFLPPSPNARINPPLRTQTFHAVNVSRRPLRNTEPLKSTNGGDLIMDLSKGDEVILKQIQEEEKEERKSWFTPRTGLIIVLVSTITVIALVLGLIFGLIRIPGVADGSDAKISNDNENANSFLNDYAIFHDPWQMMSNFQTNPDLLLLVYGPDSLRGSKNAILADATKSPSKVLNFYTQGETLVIPYSILQNENGPLREAFGIGIRFGAGATKDLRVLNMTDGAIGDLRITLPMTCFNEGSCGEVDISLFAIETDGKKYFSSSTAVLLKFGWMCSKPKQEASLTCSPTSTCGKFIESCQDQSASDLEKLSECLSQFALDTKLSEWSAEPNPKDCLRLSLMETSIVGQCVRLLGLSFDQMATEERAKADNAIRSACDFPPECGTESNINCNSVVTSRLRILLGPIEPTETPAPTHSVVLTASPTATPTITSSPASATSTPTVPSSSVPDMTGSPVSYSPASLKPTVTPTTSRPTASPIVKTRSPTMPCNPACTCPLKDPCCCRDGICAADTCPDSFS